MPPMSITETKPVSQHVHAWRGQGEHFDTAGPMQQQQRRNQGPMLQFLIPQHHIGKQLEPVSSDKAEQLHKELEKKGVVSPDGQKKQPLPGETTGAARV